MSAAHKAVGLLVLVALVTGLTLVGCGSDSKNKSAAATSPAPTVHQADVFMAGTPGASVIPHVRKPLWEEETRGFSTTTARHRMRVDVDMRDFESRPAAIPASVPEATTVSHRVETEAVVERKDTALLLAARDIEYPEMDAMLDPRFLDVQGYLRPKADVLSTSPTADTEEPGPLVHAKDGPEIGWVFHAH